MALQTVLLWIHALSGVIWTGSCASFVLGASVLATGTEEWRDFASKAAPRLDRLNLVAAIMLLATGGVNLALIVPARHYVLSRAFATVLGAKIGLFVVMALALAASWRAHGSTRSQEGSAINRAMRMSALTMVAGT